MTLRTKYDKAVCQRTRPVLFRFDFRFSSSCGHHFSVTKSGNLHLELVFEVALSITGNALVYSEFDNVIEIDKDRKVTRNHGH